MEDKKSIQLSVLALENKSKGNTPSKLEVISIQEGLQIVEAKKGFSRCNFIIPTRASDSDGNWHAGAMATLIDCIVASAVYSFTGQFQITLDFTISFFAAAKSGDEVEIVTKVAGEKGKLSTVLVEVRKKQNGELIALAKQWTATTNSKWSSLSKL